MTSRTPVDTFRPGDRVFVDHQCDDSVPRILIGEHGSIVTMNYGRGKNRGKLYARVKLDSFTEPRRVPLHALSRETQKES